MIGGIPGDAALLPHWLGATFISVLSPGIDAALAARIPFAMLLALALALCWYTTYYLARTDAAQPVAFAFGGEAQPVDYARAVADAAVLALMATLGLLQLGHETTPELAQLFAVCLSMWATAAAPFRPPRARAGVLLGLPLLAACGAPSMALLLGLALCVVGWLSRHEKMRQFVPWVAAATFLSAAVASALGSWRWRHGFALEGGQFVQLVRLWAWFMWPTWPLALWTLWRWRLQWGHRHIAVPLVASGLALAACVWMGGSDRALLLALPGLATLAAFALPTLKRSASAAVDWFSMCFFTTSAIAIWVVYTSLQWGVPAQPAVNVARLAVGFKSSFAAAPFALGVIGTLAWLWLLRWRTGRQREALWKSLVLPAGGVALSWLLLMTLWLPGLDYARSSRALVERVSAWVPTGSCLQTNGAGLAQVAALEYFGRYRVDAKPGPAFQACDFVLAVSRHEPAAAPERSTLLVRFARPTDRFEIISLYVKR